MFGVDSELLHYSGCRKSQLAPDPGPLGAELDRLFALAPLPLVELSRICCSCSCSMKEVFMVFILMEDIYMAELFFVRTFFGRVSIMDSVHNMFLHMAVFYFSWILIRKTIF